MFDLAIAANDSRLSAITVERLQTAYATHGPAARRSRALTMARIGALHARFGDPAAALSSAESALDDADQVLSQSVADDLRTLGTHLNALDDSEWRDLVGPIRQRIAVNCAQL
jgi:hypothetical protein